MYDSLAWYFAFGALHEAAHLVAFSALSSLWGQGGGNTQNHLFVEGDSDDSITTHLLRAILGRYCALPSQNDNGDIDWIWMATRHTGWIFSVFMALALHFMYQRKPNWISSSATLACYVTAMEALSTDLLGLVPMISSSSSPYPYLFCGNFGIILLNTGWVQHDGGKTALDVLETMVKVTMMRGAQQGGVVTFVQENQHGMKGIRSRVVNAKRSDLSKRIRRTLERDACRGGKLVLGTNTNMVRGFYGHTRFATSSKAEFDGTHPHQWVPRTSRRVYHPFVMDATTTTTTATTTPSPKTISVENYITHNGDLDFFQVNGKTYNLTAVQEWLEVATETPMPCTVDSAAIAGLIDLIRTQGCFGLSARFAIAFELSTSTLTNPSETRLPTYAQFEMIAKYFEKALEEKIVEMKAKIPKGSILDAISSNPIERLDMATNVLRLLQTMDGGATQEKAFVALLKWIDEEQGASLMRFVEVTIDAFFDNDLLFTTQYFMKHAKGSFGLAIITSLDAHRQVCFAARGQTMSIAFYPKKGIICYGSEQAAVKAALKAETPDGSDRNADAGPAARFDLDDLSGEIVLLDWGDDIPAISPPNRKLVAEKLMGGKLNVVVAKTSTCPSLGPVSRRLIELENNPLITPLPEEAKDLVLKDIQDIPRICRDIQKDWREPGLNRMSAWTLRQAILKRMKGIVDGSIRRSPKSVDILFTGCEVSLWLAEQTASDLQKAFPELGIQAVSSNKILGLFGQELTVPSVGYPMSQKTHDLKDVIVVIVSHSGGTFAPLACSNLLQSTTQNMFVVASEWDTQIGKQLRGMSNDTGLPTSRIFSTGVGLRSAEPCSVSVAATHQILTNIFELISVAIIGEPSFRYASGALITNYDLQILETCNQKNVVALEHIVGVTAEGEIVPREISHTVHELRAVGTVWAQHILENAKAYVISFLYIVGTVTTFPLVTGLAIAFGLDDEKFYYITRFLDSLIYFWLPQINIMILRFFEGRNLCHRMVGRTVVIGDIPWVAQSAEAFLGKLFACSYSIAGLNVHSGNPGDHLVHRHTHRVVRGSLLVCGRPDGRLSALTSLEASTCLSVNQACSIQSFGGTAECITIGHNPHKLPLTAWGVALETHRPNFLCEVSVNRLDRRCVLSQIKSARSLQSNALSRSFHRSVRLNDDDTSQGESSFSSHSRLQGIYEDASRSRLSAGDNDPAIQKHLIDTILDHIINEKSDMESLRLLFEKIDTDNSGSLDQDEFIRAFSERAPSLTRAEIVEIFHDNDIDKNGTLDFDEFISIAKNPQASAAFTLLNEERRVGPLLDVPPTKERYFGENIRKMHADSVDEMLLSSHQQMAMELYESRVASLQRFVAMTVLFHQIGKKVQDFFPAISFGLLGYRIDRTQSNLRIATTASPVGGADVRNRMLTMKMRYNIERSVRALSRSWPIYQQAKIAQALAQHSKSGGKTE